MKSFFRIIKEKRSDHGNKKKQKVLRNRNLQKRLACMQKYLEKKNNQKSKKDLQILLVGFDIISR